MGVRGLGNVAAAVVAVLAAVFALLLLLPAPVVAVPLAIASLVVGIVLVVRDDRARPVAVAAVLVSVTALLASAAFWLLLTPAHFVVTDGGTTAVSP